MRLMPVGPGCGQGVVSSDGEERKGMKQAAAGSEEGCQEAWGRGHSVGVA